jgi:hypothetical protein
MAVGKTSATHELSLVMSRSAISVFSDGFTATRTATGLVRAGTQWTKQLRQIIKIRLSKRNFRTHQDGLEHAPANS